MLRLYMVNYIANSKNRKFKKQILSFFERLNFGAGKLPLSGRIILVMSFLLLLSLLFPWLHCEFLSAAPKDFGAFSYATGYIGYGIIISVILIPFFLLSHSKKEKIRAHIPFRLSDTQAVVFIAALLLTSLLHLLFMSRVFQQFVQTIEIGHGFLMATSSVICIIISAFFLSKNTKEQAREIRYLDHYDTENLAEYRSIIDGTDQKSDKSDDTNMTLPI